MRFLKKASDGRAVYRFERTEREMFAHALELFPVQKRALRKISDDASAQELLEKSLADHRAKLRLEGARLLGANGELTIDADFNEYWDLKLNDAEIEWLLQMLNDIRVGLWTQLGCPVPTFDPKMLEQPDEERVRSSVIMQLCAEWQGALMGADGPVSQK